MSRREEQSDAADLAEQAGAVGGAAAAVAVDEEVDGDEGVEIVNGQSMSNMAPAGGALSEGGAATGGGGAATGERGRGGRRKKTLFEKAEAFVSRLASRNNFWHAVTSMIWLPFAFKSGIKIKRLSPAEFTDNQRHGEKTAFEAILPFRKFNKNWYNAMAGAALLGNAEIAGGMYVFGTVGGDYTVVCKRLEYRFMRPCLGPAIYRIAPQDDLDALVATRDEFNIALRMNVVQQARKPGTREKRVGVVDVEFHVTPKVHHKEKRTRRKSRD